MCWYEMLIHKTFSVYKEYRIRIRSKRTRERLMGSGKQKPTLVSE